MSIWGSTLVFDANDHAPECAQWVTCECLDPHVHPQVSMGGWKHWRYDEQAPCTCGAGPIAYRESHNLPANDDPRGGCFDLAEIPSHITRDGRDDQPEDGAPWPYLRVSVNEETVVLTRAQVGELLDTLGSWYDRSKEEDSTREFEAEKEALQAANYLDLMRWFTKARQTYPPMDTIRVTTAQANAFVAANVAQVRPEVRFGSEAYLLGLRVEWVIEPAASTFAEGYRLEKAERGVRSLF